MGRCLGGEMSWWGKVLGGQKSLVGRILGWGKVMVGDVKWGIVLGWEKSSGEKSGGEESCHRLILFIFLVIKTI